MSTFIQELRPSADAIPLDSRDTRDLNTQAIDNNRCQVCKVRKLGTCICKQEISAAVEELNLQLDKIKHIHEVEVEAHLLEEQQTEAALPSTAQSFMNQDANGFTPERFTERTLHPLHLAVMADLLQKGLLQITRNPEMGTLRFSYEYNANQEVGDHTKFINLMDAIVQQLEIFMLENNIRNSCHTLGVDLISGRTNALSITFPRLEHYHNFNLLLAAVSQEQQHKRQTLSSYQMDRLKNPLTTRLVPIADAPRTDEEKEREYASPFRILGPRDGLMLKPRGCK